MIKLITNKAILLAAICILLLPTLALAGDLDSLIKRMNERAIADLGSFKASLSATFNVPHGTVSMVLSNVDSPADAYVCLKLGVLAGQPPEVVLQQYRAHKHKGWGFIAKQLGIKPGSKEFHALKEGRLDSSTGAEHAPGPGKGRKGGNKGRKGK